MKPRTALKSMNLIMLLALALTACAGKTTPVPAQTTAPGAPAEKALTFVIPEDPPSFNPIIADTGYDALVKNLVLLGMTGIDPEGNVFPELAADLPTQENGGVAVDDAAGTMSVTWKMRQDIQWSDGRPVNADDVVFTYEALTNPDTGNWIPGIDYVDSLEKIDDYTFKINYNTIYPAYLTQLGGEQVVIWPAHYCDAKQGYSSWDCARQPLSDGPFVLKDWVEGDHMTFVRNENYFDKGKPAVDKITVKIVPDATVRKQMMLNGDADLNMWINEAVTSDLEKSDKAKVSISPHNRFVMRLYMNEAKKGTTDAQATPHPILSDVRVRQAIRTAIDVDTISEQIFYGYSQPVWTEFFRPPYDQCGIAQPKYDLEAAKAQLEAAGWKDTDGDGIRECHGCKTGAPTGYPMEMEFITYQEYGEPILLTQQLIAEELRQIGIKLNLTAVEGSVLWADAKDGGIEQSGNFDIDLWDDGYAGVDPTDYLSEDYSIYSITPGNGWNIARWKNEEFDSLLQETYTLDESTRQMNFCKMAKILDEQVPIILMFTTITADAYSNRLQGVQSTVNDVVTWNVADWTLK